MAKKKVYNNINLSTECAQNLGIAIIKQAADDYREVKHILQTNPNNTKAKAEVENIRNFFFGDLFKSLTELNPHYLLNRLDAEFA